MRAVSFDLCTMSPLSSHDCPALKDEGTPHCGQALTSSIFASSLYRCLYWFRKEVPSP